MSRHKTSIYNGLVRSKVKEPDLKPRQLSPEKILFLRYQCAIENKDFETAKALKSLMALMDSTDEPKVGASQKEDVSDARQKAEQLFSKRKT
jgi:hypothetical protein